MAERLAYLEAVIGADITQFRKSMRDIRNETGFLSESINGIAGAARTATFAFTAPMAALGTYAVQAGMEFEASMRNINAIAGMSEDALSALSERTLEFGKNTRAGANEAAKALYTVFSAGITDTEQAFAAMEVATYTAEAGLANMEVTTEALVASMLSYGDTSEEMAWRASNALTRMVAVGVGSMENFAGAVANVLPSASALGMDIEELYGNMAFLTQRGLSASRASTALNSALTALAKPTEAMQTAMRSLGVNGAEELIERFGGVNGAFQALLGTTRGTQAEIQAMFNNIRGARAINLFATDIDGWNRTLAEFRDGLETATMDAWEQQSESFAYSWDRLTASLEAAGIVVAQVLMPALKPIIDFATDMLIAFTELDPVIMRNIVGFTSLAAIAAPVVWALSSFVASGLALPTAFIAAALSIESVRNALMGLRAVFSPTISDLTDLGTEIYNLLTGRVEEAVTSASDVDLTRSARVDLNPAQLIRVTGTTSLWDIFESQGFAESMSWQEFMRRATEGGWEGGAITPDMTINLGGVAVEGEDRLQGKIAKSTGMEFLDMMVKDDGGDTLYNRIRAIVNRALPVVQGIMLDFVNSVGSWLVTSGTNLFSGLTGIFSDGTWITTLMSNIKTAVGQLSEGDFAGAFFTLFPNMSNALSKGFSGLNIDFSGLLEAMSGFGETFMTWATTSAIPAISNTAGFIAGKIASLLYSGVQAAFGALSALLTGGGTEGALSTIGDYVGENVIGEFSSGFSEAIAGSDLQVDTTTLVDGLQTNANTLISDIETALSGVTTILDNTFGSDTANMGSNLLEGLTGMFRELGAIDPTAIKNIALAVGAVIAVVAGEAAQNARTILPALASSLRAFINIFSDESLSNPTAMVANLITVFTGVGVAIVSIPFNLVLTPLDALVTGFGNLIGVDLSGWAGGVRTAFEQVAYILTHPLEMAEAVSGLNATAQGFEIPEGAAVVPISLIPDVTWDVEGSLLPDADATDIFYSLTDSLIMGEGGVSGLQYRSEGTVGYLSVPVGGALVFDGSIEQGEFINSFLQSFNAGDFEGTRLESVASGLYSQIMTAFTEAANTGDDVLPAGTGIADSITTAIENEIAAIETTDINLDSVVNLISVSAGMGMDGDTFVSEVFEPIATGATNLLGAGSPFAIALDVANLAIQDFDGNRTIFDNVTLAITNMAAEAALIGGRMESALQTASDNLMPIIDGIIGQFLTLDDTAIDIFVNTHVSGTGVDGSHATGLNYVPFDGYVAELHRGEMVVPASEAASLRSGAAGGAVTQNNVININGVQNADVMLRELRRRGIDLERRT